MNCIILYVVKTERRRQSVGLKWGYFAKMYVLRKKKKKKNRDSKNNRVLLEKNSGSVCNPGSTQNGI